MLLLKMENLNLNKKINSITPNKWKMIEEIGWYWKAKEENPNDEVAKYLIENYPTNVIVELKNFVVRKRLKLQGFILGYCKSSPIEFKDKIQLSDDSLWDFSSHIVGLGEVMYNYVIDHPNCIIELQKDYVENFEYGFDKAIYEIENSKYD